IIQSSVHDYNDCRSSIVFSVLGGSLFIYHTMTGRKNGSHRINRTFLNGIKKKIEKTDHK
ncbi:hypothetical protein, partial [Erwinia sp. V71]|uniref:hypothetical protein n=1 Tax=Erwinia sp. V71 TaxID=3369424 RepID=UPI003F625836